MIAEVVESRAETIVLLGDEPVRHWLRRLFDRRWSALGDFAETDNSYGRRHVMTTADHRYEVLPAERP